MNIWLGVPYLVICVVSTEGKYFYIKIDTKDSNTLSSQIHLVKDFAIFVANGQGCKESCNIYFINAILLKQRFYNFIKILHKEASLHYPKSCY